MMLPVAAGRTLGFALTSAGDAALAGDCLRRLREVYPRSRIVLVTDGDDDPAYDGIAASNRAQLVRGEHCFAQEAGGGFWQRLLDLHAEEPTDCFFKIDTDTRFHRPILELPDPDQPQVFGTIRLDPRFIAEPHCQGGCTGLTRGALDLLRESRLFQDPGYRDPDYACAVTPHPAHIEDRKRCGRISTDLILTDVCLRLGIPLVSHPEILCLWRNPGDDHDVIAPELEAEFSNDQLRYAVTHPHKQEQPSVRVLEDAAEAAHPAVAPLGSRWKA